jgi:pimeloyl-ACP methyl ester carboxylesterase
MSATEDPATGEVREGYAEIGDQRLHYVETGEGPLIVLLHGFPRVLVRLAAADPAARGRRLGW